MTADSAPPLTSPPTFVETMSLAPPKPKSRVIAAFLALLLGAFGVHKMYLGKVGLGLLYALFFWTYIPAFIAWIEGVRYLATSDDAWAAKQGAPVQRSNGAAIVGLWVFALLPLLAMIAIVALIFLGSQVQSLGPVTRANGQGTLSAAPPCVLVADDPSLHVAVYVPGASVAACDANFSAFRGGFDANTTVRLFISHDMPSGIPDCTVDGAQWYISGSAASSTLRSQICALG
jgi:TM2 domain-containing membrane protein YozV